MRSVALFLAGLLMSTGAVAADPSTFSRRVAAGARDQVSVSNVAGSVRVIAWDRPEVDVQGRLGSGVERVDVLQGRSGVDIRVVLRESRSVNRNGQAQLDIRVPAGSELEVIATSASIVVEGVRGRSRLKSVSGSIRAQNQGEPLEARTVSGSIYVSGSGRPGRTQASSVSGAVTIERVAGDLEVNSTSGMVRVSAESVDDAQIHTVSGSISFQGRLTKDGDLEVEAVSGTVNVMAAAEAGYKYDVSTFSGAIRACFDSGDDHRRSRGPGSQLSGVRGQGSARVRLRAMSGGVSVCDRY